MGDLGREYGVSKHTTYAMPTPLVFLPSASETSVPHLKRIIEKARDVEVTASAAVEFNARETQSILQSIEALTSAYLQGLRRSPAVA